MNMMLVYRFEGHFLDCLLSSCEWGAVRTYSHEAGCCLICSDQTLAVFINHGIVPVTELDMGGDMHNAIPILASPPSAVAGSSNFELKSHKW